MKINNVKSKMKILVVGPYPPPFSGPESSIKLLMESPLHEKADLCLINTNYRKNVAAKGKKDLTALTGIFFLVCRVFLQSLVFRPKIVYYYVTATIPGWLFKDIWIILAAKLAFRRVVIHMRAGHFRFSYDSAKKWQKFLIRFVCGRCSAGLVQGKDLRNQFDMVMPQERIHVIYNMIDNNKYRNLEPDNYIPHRFFFLGHLSFAKGYCDLLAVIPRIVAEFKDSEFVFAGYKLKQERNIYVNQLNGEILKAKDPEECFQKYIVGKCEPNYTYLGPIDECRKIEELKKCTALVLPSYSEGFSMSVLEALAMGKPVVCTPVGALKEVVHDSENGFVVQPGNPESLYKAIREVIVQKETVTKMRRYNQIYVGNNFSCLRITNQLYTIFSKI